MATEAEEKKLHMDLGQGEKESKVLPPGFGWLSVPIPKKARKHARIQALRSDMPWQEYIARLCMEAPCYKEETIPQQT